MRAATIAVPMPPAAPVTTTEPFVIPCPFADAGGEVPPGGRYGAVTRTRRPGGTGPARESRAPVSARSPRALASALPGLLVRALGRLVAGGLFRVLPDV